jgi:hypothetical protein
MVSQDMDSTNRLLKVIIALMLRPREDKALSLKQQIEVLHGLGIGPSDIAEILGKTGGHINKELSGIRKRRKQEK